MNNQAVVDLSGSLQEVWRLLNNGERKILRKHASIQHFKKNKTIYVEGDIPKDMMCLLKGKVKILKEGLSGRSQIIRIIRPIQCFGYRAYFAQENYLTGAVAFEPSIVCLIPMDIVIKLLQNNPKLMMYFIKQLSIDLGTADTRVVTLSQKHLRGRLAESLVSLINSYGLEEDNTISIYLTRDDLANLSSMTTSNAIRILGDFVTEKVITLDGRKIKVIDEEKLRKISRLG